MDALMDLITRVGRIENAMRPTPDCQSQWKIWDAEKSEYKLISIGQALNFLACNLDIPTYADHSHNKELH
jgi:hypothetical protein